MQFVTRCAGSSLTRVGVLAGAFNPPTVAHAELVEAARDQVDEVVCVMPKTLPHKQFDAATLEERLGLLSLLRTDLRCSVAVSEGGLLIDIARECREHFGTDARLFFICGRDAAERIMTWDYGEPRFHAAMLREFELLVAPRGGRYVPPPDVEQRVHALPLTSRHEAVSSTEVRERIARGDAWEHLVPQPIVHEVRRIYQRG